MYTAQTVPPTAEKSKKRGYGYSVTPIVTLTPKRTPGTKRPQVTSVRRMREMRVSAAVLESGA